MVATNVVLDLIEADRRRIPPGGSALGQQLVFTDNITHINNAPIAAGVGQHSGFCFRVRRPSTAGGADVWLCQAGFILPGIPPTFPNGGQIEARGLLDFAAGTIPDKVAITGGTGDFVRAGGEIELQTVNPGPPEILRYTLKIETL
jgi:hypothetical protein